MKFRMNFFVTFLIATVLCVVVSTGFAQSSDQSLPTPVLTSEVNGTIAPLDLGDSRVTRHFYAFDASPGDLIITTDSKNLNGDIDVFTAVTFRPLMKTTMYANTQMPEVTKSIFLRVHQILILRIEARTPSDEAGSYHIRFRGSFEPFSGGIPVAEATESTAESPRSSRGTKRVSSVGATIAEPPAEATAKTEPTPAPVSEPRAVATGSEPAEKPSTASETAKKPEASKSTTAKTTAKSTPRNTRRRAPARSKPAAQPKESAETSANKSETEPAKASDTVKKETPGGGKSNAAVSKTTATPEQPAQEITPPPTGVRLVIEQKDGTKIDRPMSTVRRVVVEGNVIVIVLKTGRIERVPMSAVTRMAIEP